MAATGRVPLSIRLGFPLASSASHLRSDSRIPTANSCSVIGRRAAIHMTGIALPCGSRRARAVAKSAEKKIDAHVHVWANAEQKEEFPFPGGEPPFPGNAELLLESMKEAGVHGAVMVQPANHKFDHSYVSGVMSRYPGRFVGCLLADPTDGGGGVPELDRLITQEGYRAVRFNPYLWPEGRGIADEVGREMFKRAGELGVPVGIMTFKGLLLHIEDITELCKSYPGTKVILDHFAFCKCAQPGSEEWQALLGLAKFPQVHVKCSGFFRVSEQPYPYMDARPMIRRLIGAFGSGRLLWGTDFPWIMEQCGYAKAWQVIDDGDAIEGKPLLTQEERRCIFGHNVMRLFPGGWF